MSIVENICPATWTTCNKANKFWFTPQNDGSKRTIQLCRPIVEEDDECIECYYCILPICFIFDISCFPCNWCYFSDYCYLKNNKVKPVFFEQNKDKQNEICIKNENIKQNLEKSTKSNKTCKQKMRNSYEHSCDCDCAFKNDSLKYTKKLEFKYNYYIV